MDRAIVYASAIPLDTDLLKTNKNAMIALGMAIQSILGTSTWFDGLACTPTGPASLQVLVGPGSVSSLQNVDSTAYGSLAADTSHQIMKQGINLGTLTLSCPAPATTGQSINYLIQAAYQDTDGGSTVLPYYNASNPSVAYNGPNNTGVSQNTVRQGQCIVSEKAGVAAATGSQTTPAPDAGYTGLWVVTVANGQTQITSGNIAAVSGAPLITEKLNDKISIATGDARYLSGGLPSRTALFTSSGTWTAPTGVTKILVDAVAGGGGGGGTNGTTNGGEGGGGGDGVKGQTLTVVPGTTYTITVGTGGTHGGISANGSSGTATSIGALLTLTPGGGGNFSGASGGSSTGLGGLSGDANLLFGGSGGGTLFGQGANVRQGLGVAGSGYGVGGSGGSVVGGVGSVGGDGRPGFVLIQW